jgi:hypothetical protein
MSKKNSNPKSIGRIEFSETRIPKKKTSQSDPFARITLHPLEELEPRDFEPEASRLPTLPRQPGQPTSALSFPLSIYDDESITDSAEKVSTNDDIPPKSGTGLPSQAGLPSLPTSSKFVNNFQEANKLPNKINQFPVSPERDFQKVPNSVTRVALAGGLFKGKSKQIYDFLWSVSRGSINPARVVRKTRMEIKAGAGLGSKNTLDSGLAHLELLGLIKIKIESGSLQGNEYEVFTIEESSLPSLTGYPSLPTFSGQAGIPENTQNQGNPGSPLLGEGGEAQIVEKQPLYEESKTFFKTNKEENDDERLRAAFSEFIFILEEGLKKHTGKGISPEDKMKWKHVAEVLVAQIELIASRTTISNAPAVLAEHLQRHLNNKRVLERMGLITPAEAKQIKEPVSVKQEIPYLFLCPDCKGTRMWNPDGLGMRPNCPHQGLENAVKRAKDVGEI